MPKVPSRQSKVLEELEEQSRLYSQKATLLSNLLEQAEQFLREMPGKVAIQTGLPHRDFDLAFIKMGGDWRLVFVEYEGETPKLVPVVQATILQKAEAAKLLPELYGLLVDKLTEGQAEIDRGLESLKDLPFLDLGEHAHLIEKTPAKGDVDDIPF